jgi:N-acetylglutamate synthase-like GNAT family acetyltransferase
MAAAANAVTGRVRKIRRRRLAGELSVEQTRDLALVAAILEASGIRITGLDRPAACYLLAYSGAEPVGAVGVETVVDAGLMRVLAVTARARRHGIGAALVAAARKAAHTRGARRLFALAPDGNYLRRFGFVPVTASELSETIGGVSATLPARDESVHCSVFCLDISSDGVIVR